ncbi:ribosome small subunit-dependent GTPase A [Pseudogracilibacillus sp. ICA-222130]|uniref:ribosome small subunit-dependent GTPase A n=1 Tax=Pseudogracilibacillus sp. ICA-222130 TaxID=3134655 RepID=UPI0030BB59FC
MKEGRIVKALSGFYYVQTENALYACKGRGVFRNKKITPLVGDYVWFKESGDLEGYITTIEERKNEFVRPPIANITQAVIVNAITAPSFNPYLLDRFLVITELKGIKPCIVMTKKDLATEKELMKMDAYKADYEQLGYDVFIVSLQKDDEIAFLKTLLKNEITVLMGQSGAGKSTLLNTINPSLSIETGEISMSLGRGKHTTRHVELHDVGEGLVADTPGFSSIDFDDMDHEQLMHGFVEISEISSYCKFRSCLHVKEPKCAVKAAVENKEIKQYRYDHYVQFLQEIMERKPRY